MITQSVEITSSGIKKVLRKHTPERAIAEYIWNGFDAKATEINIDFKIDTTKIESFKSITISDDGEGIVYEELGERFRKFYESNKSSISTSNTNLTKGKNGYGRFTFHKFARFATWSTVYKKSENELLAYDISMNSENLKEYTPTIPIKSNTKTGTSVEFIELHATVSPKFIDNVLIPYLKAEFAWFLELKEEFKIFINGKELDYSSIIEEVDSYPIEIKSKEEVLKFECKYIRWKKKLNDEYSRFYFLNKDLAIKKTKTTSLNKKGDDFWHSLVIVGDFFNTPTSEDDSNEEETLELFGTGQERKVFKELINKLNEYLKKKRRPFLRVQADKLVKKYEDEKVFPNYSDNEWDQVRKQGLENLVKEIYEVEPAVFMKLNKEQKRIFLELLNLVMDKSESDSLFKIIDAVIELDSADRKEFAKILEMTRLKQVISTINLIKDRLIIVDNLKKIVFNHDLKANERDHLQKFVEKHYWIFGEEYRMVCAEEVKFEEALRRYIYILRGINKKEFIEHPDKYKEMDLFLAGTDFRDGKPHNVIIEIKSPTSIKRLKSVHMTQIEEYMDVILKQDCFNDANEEWTFFLIGQDYDDILSRRILNKETGLVIKGDNYSLYLKKWSEVVNEVERRLKYLLEKLKIERGSLSQKNTLEEIIPTVKK
ncbi:ATP-binding protein [Saccharicrinis aurantiacus]|uniref:ATP-binding protein n=1 Tax=Saccharicrinis aurantiacus TaxID=1849719 RepID=UPI00249294CC|nr:ATP-binding protein [Saccharicrinis aurantiacus]